MNNDRPLITRPGNILLTVLAAATGYFIVGPHVSATVLYVGTAVAVALTLIVGYLMREPIDDEDYDDEPDQDAERWATAAGFVVIAIGVVSLPHLADGIVQSVAHVAITIMLSVHVAGEVYQAKSGAR